MSWNLNSNSVCSILVVGPCTSHLIFLSLGFFFCMMIDLSGLSGGNPKRCKVFPSLSFSSFICKMDILHYFPLRAVGQAPCMPSNPMEMRVVIIITMVMSCWSNRGRLLNGRGWRRHPFLMGGGCSWWTSMVASGCQGFGDHPREGDSCHCYAPDGYSLTSGQKRLGKLLDRLPHKERLMSWFMGGKM